MGRDHITSSRYAVSPIPGTVVVRSQECFRCGQPTNPPHSIAENSCSHTAINAVERSFRACYHFGLNDSSTCWNIRPALVWRVVLVIHIFVISHSFAKSHHPAQAKRLIFLRSSFGTTGISTQTNHGLLPLTTAGADRLSGTCESPKTHWKLHLPESVLT